MNEPVTISAVLTHELKQLLERWASQEDRTVSATLRQILTKEAHRRGQLQSRQEVTYQTK